MIILHPSSPDSSEYEVLYTDELLDVYSNNTLKISQLIELRALEIVILPNLEHLDGTCVVVFSDGIKCILESSSIYLKGEILEVSSFINTEGKVIEELKESEINNILRIIFKVKPKHTFICLTNSLRNSIHETSMANIIKGAGYNFSRSSSILNL